MAIIASVIVTPAVEDAEQGLIFTEFPTAAVTQFSISVSDIQYVDISLATQYAIPIAEVQYIDIAAKVEVDSLGRYQFFFDVAAVVDEINLDIDYFLPSEITIPTDALAFTLARPAMDETFSTDKVFLNFGVGQFDEVLATDLLSTALLKLLTSPTSMADTILGKGLTKILLDEAEISSDIASIDLDKLASDIFEVPDAIALNTGLSSLDSASLTDLFLKAFNKSLSDSNPVIDTIVGRVITKLLEDSAIIEDLVGIPDGATFKLCKYSSDFQKIVEQLSQFMEKQIGDIYSLSDQSFLEFITSFSDDVGTTDSSDVATTKGLFESIESLDNLNYSASKTTFDVFSLESQKALHTTKTQAHAFSLGDQSSINFFSELADNLNTPDFTSYTADKILSEVFGLSDFLGYVSDKQTTDSVFAESKKSIYTHKAHLHGFGTSDSGLVVAQNYSDTSYFLEDYVGDYRQF